MNTKTLLLSAAQFGQEDAQQRRDMQGSTLFLFDSPAWLAYTAAYNATAPAKRVVAIGRSRGGQPFQVTTEEL
jgi:hypothetical protein